MGMVGGPGIEKDLSGTGPGSVFGPGIYAVPISGATLTASAMQAGYQLEPAGDLTSLTVVMPPSPSDGFEFWVASTKTVSGLLATAPAGQTVEPSSAGAITLGAAGRLTWKYRAPQGKWYGQF